MSENMKASNGFSLTLLIVGVVVLVVIASIIIAKITGEDNSAAKIAKKASRVITRADGFSFDENTPGYQTYLELLQGCPGGKDCIPSIDQPSFESKESASSWLLDEDVVFVVDYREEVRVYPQKILNRHEIVNDIVSGDPLAITFCPLCGSALAFDRRIEGQTLEFGVSGKLHNTDLVMYDRNTESLWQQVTGEAIVGEMFGKKLKQISMSGMRFRDFKKEFSKGEVLSRPSSLTNYDYYPYGDYEESKRTIFPVNGGVDTTIHPKTVVYGIEVEGSFKAYPEEKIKEEGEIEDLINGVSVNIFYSRGNVKAQEIKTGKEIVTTRLFWFAWKAFRPETLLY